MMYRSHHLTLHIREIKQLGDSQISTINIGNLTPDNVKSLVAEAMGMEGDEDVVSTLAMVVHQKTDGNAFFVLMFLRSLHDQELLQYNFGSMMWMWDDEEVKSQLVTQNVATVMINKLKRFKHAQQTIIKVAACLGASFSIRIITLIAEKMRGWELPDDDVPSLIKLCVDGYVKEGLWEKDLDEDIISFSHDKIQSAAIQLISNESDVRDKFRGDIGNYMFQTLDEVDIEENLFVVVSLRNCGRPTLSKGDRKALAHMNLQAGLRASDNAAFDSAAKYFKEGKTKLYESPFL